VSHFVEAPAGVVMVTRDEGGQEHWVPAAPPHLQRVDLAAGEIVVDWPAELE
jgi:ribosomal 30S subunit maturation factor RimM